MYIKLALRSARRTARDYLIYMVTLTLSVGMFYGFFSLASPYYSETLPVQLHLDILGRVMRIAVPLVGVLVVFLMSCVNSFMLRQKQKEFAVETVIGMEQRSVAFLFFLETLVIGVGAILLGILLGVLLSQVISVIVVQSFGETYRLNFMIFPDTLLGTVLFFGMLFVLTGLKNINDIRKTKTIEMLQNSQSGMEAVPLTKQLGKWVAGGAVLSVIVLGMMIFLFRRVLAYPKVFLRILVISFLAAGFVTESLIFACKKDTEGSEDSRGVNHDSPFLMVIVVCGLAESILLLSSYHIFDTLVRQGLASEWYAVIPSVCAILLLIVSMIALFGCLTWIMTKIIRKPSARYYRHLFLLGQIRIRMGSSAKTMGVISCVLAASLVLFAYFPVLAVRIESYQMVLSVFDVQVGTMYPANEEAVLSGTLDYDAITEYLEQEGCPVVGTAQGELFFLDSDSPFLAVELSVYNDLRSLSGMEPIQLMPDEYGIAWDNEVMESDIRECNRRSHVIQAGSATLSKAEGADFQDPVGINLFTRQTEAVYVIPDHAAQGLRMATTFYSANTEYPLSYEFAVQFEREMGEYQRKLGNFPAESAFVRLNTLQVSEGMSIMLMLELIGAYAALVLLICSFTMMSVQQLTDAIEQKRRFVIIGKLGVGQESISRNIRQQMCFWFGLPVLTAVIGSLGVLCYLIRSSYKTIVAYISLERICVIFVGVYVIFLLIFGCYFAATYYLFQKSCQID